VDGLATDGGDPCQQRDGSKVLEGGDGEIVWLEVNECWGEDILRFWGKIPGTKSLLLLPNLGLVVVEFFGLVAVGFWVL